jgi:hypothetical protein
MGMTKIVLMKHRGIGSKKLDKLMRTDGLEDPSKRGCG